MAELIQVCLPGTNADKIAAIMEEVLPTAEEAPLQVDSEELRAVLEGDAAIIQETRQSFRQEIQPCHNGWRGRSLSKLHGSVGVKSQAAGRPVTVELHTPAAAIGHWAGKGGARWTAQDDKHNVFLSFIIFKIDRQCKVRKVR